MAANIPTLFFLSALSNHILHLLLSQTNINTHIPPNTHFFSHLYSPLLLHFQFWIKTPFVLSIFYFNFILHHYYLHSSWTNPLRWLRTLTIEKNFGRLRLKSITNGRLYPTQMSISIWLSLTKMWVCFVHWLFPVGCLFSLNVVSLVLKFWFSVVPLSVICIPQLIIFLYDICIYFVHFYPSRFPLF